MDNELRSLFREVFRWHRYTVQKYLDELDLYIGQPRFLSTIERNPGITQKELVASLNVSKESASVSLKRLEASGYIERKVDEKDRRAKKLYLTKRGKITSDALKENFEKIDNAMFQSFSSEEQDQLKSYFEIMLIELKKGVNE